MLKGVYNLSIQLKITFDNGEIWIRGDKEGLLYLADCCTRVIGKKDPSGHFHLLPEMNNLLEGSTKIRLGFLLTQDILNPPNLLLRMILLFHDSGKFPKRPGGFHILLIPSLMR